MKKHLTMMLNELQSSWLEVTKIPSQHGGYIRVPVSVNAEWYSRFCSRFQRTRRKYPKLRTIIKRCHTIAALKRMQQGDRITTYARRLLDFMEVWFDQWPN